MSRSLKKGPFIDGSLAKKIEEMNHQGDRKIIKTWSRRSTITPDFVGHTFGVHNGKKHIRHTKSGLSSKDKFDKWARARKELSGRSKSI